MKNLLLNLSLETVPVTSTQVDKPSVWLLVLTVAKALLDGGLTSAI